MKVRWNKEWRGRDVKREDRTSAPMDSICSNHCTALYGS